MKSARILVVDDEALNRRLLQTLLSREGFHVDLASNGREAIEAVRAENYQLILLDIQMPGMNGLEAARAIAALVDVPIVAFSADVGPERVREFRAAGIAFHLGKPFRREKLLTVVSSALQTCPPSREDRNGGFDELVALLGSEAANEGARRLKQLIEEFLATPANEHTTLLRYAHALVSHAALVGFPKLAAHCRALEQASHSEDVFGEPLRRARTSAQQALPELYKMAGS